MAVDPHARYARLIRQADRTFGLEAWPESWCPPGPGKAPQTQEPSPSPSTRTRPSTSNPSAQSAPAATRPRPAPAPPPAVADEGDRHERLRRIALTLSMDPKILDLQPPGTKLVFGEGDPNARLVFVGEAPGETEDQLGRPFVGKAGQLLEKMIGAMGLSREAVYIVNIVNFRPPGNRTPTPEESAAGLPYLVQQLEVIRPGAIVTLGGSSTKAMLETSTGITRLRGTWQTFTMINPPIPLMPTFHPAYLLRSYTPENRKRVWSDLQAVMTELGIAPNSSD